MLSLSTNFSVVNLILPFYIFFWFSGAIAVIAIEMFIMFITFMGKHITMEHINPSWFLGATGLLLVPGTGTLVVEIEHLRDLALFLFDFSFGAGFFLYISLFSIWIYRFILHEPLHKNRIALFWINLGPIGASLTSLLSYYYFFPGLDGVSIFFSLLFFGIGVWWFFMAIMVTIYYLDKMKVPYKTAWWSFTFPLGQFLIGAFLFNSFLEYRSIDDFLLVLYFILILMWTINIILTLRCLFKRNIVMAQRMD